MAAKVVGFLFIAVGAFFLVKPEWCRNSLRRKAARRLRWYLFAAVVGVGILLISAGWKYPGIWPKFVAVVGVIAVIKGLTLVKAKMAEEVKGWILRQPVWVLRLFAIAHIAFGMAIWLGMKG